MTLRQQLDRVKTEAHFLRVVEGRPLTSWRNLYGRCSHLDEARNLWMNYDREVLGRSIGQADATQRFEQWAIGGRCPYFACRSARALLFDANRSLYSTMSVTWEDVFPSVYAAAELREFWFNR